MNIAPAIYNPDDNIVITRRNKKVFFFKTNSSMNYGRIHSIYSWRVEKNNKNLIF